MTKESLNPNLQRLPVKEYMNISQSSGIEELIQNLDHPNL
jgi:hypothetical protein